MESVSANRLGRKNKRGVSPIIATILLVAITVVLAAVLYILVTGLLGGHTSVTSAITMTANTGGTCFGANTYSISVGGATQTVTTANFGISLTAAGATTSTAPGTAGTASKTNCGVTAPTSGWIAELVSPGGAVQQAYYDSAGWHAWNATLPVTISGGQTIIIVAAPSVTLTQASIGVFGQNGATVTGSVTL